MAAKLALIDPDLLLRLINNQKPPPNVDLPPVNPTLREMNTTETQINTALSRKGDPTARLGEINKLLNTHSVYTDNYEKKPVKLPFHFIPGSTPTPSPHMGDMGEDPHMGDLWMTNIVDSLPKTTQKTGKLLLQHIKASGGKVAWDEQGRLLIAGKIIPETNILDLIHSVVRIRKTAPLPSGVHAFVDALKLLNTPTELLRNKPPYGDKARPIATPRRERNIPKGQRKRRRYSSSGWEQL